MGNRLSVTDANTHTTTYVYDALNRRIESRNPLGYVTRYGYDNIGNRTVLTDANGVVTTFSYDKVNRLTNIDYSDATPDVTFSYNKVGQRIAMSDGTGVTTYTHDALYRLTGVNDGAGQQVSYAYDAVGNRTRLIYPDGRVVTYTYDPGNRLNTVTDWNNGQFGYDYDAANRMTGLTPSTSSGQALPNGVESSYTYDAAGRLTLLTHQSPITQPPIAGYAYNLDKVGNRRVLTETLLVPSTAAPNGAYLEENGLVVMEAENAAQITGGASHAWQLKTIQNGYTGTAYLQSLPDFDTLYATTEITGSPALRYPVEFSTPGTYTVWLRGMASNAGSDSAYVGLGEQMVEVTGFAPGEWDWGSESANGELANLVVQQSGLYTLSVWMREDGLRVDRLLLTADASYVPANFGPAETARQTEASTGTLTTLARTIAYGYDDLYRLTSANYTSGEAYQYVYDPVGNRLQQIINGDTTEYLYDAANRLAAVDGVSYTFDANGNLFATGSMTNTWDAANRLISANRDGNLVQPIYNGLGDRVGQTVGVTTTHFALDVQGLPEVIYTSNGETFIHLPGVIVAESAAGETRYLLSDGLGSVRQAVDAAGSVVSYQEYDPYGNPIVNRQSKIVNRYGYTGEWYESYIHLLFLRARWYAPETGTFLSVDAWEGTVHRSMSMNGWAYAEGNPVKWIDPSGHTVRPTDIPDRAVYSCKCGWIDWDHVIPGKAINLLTRIGESGSKVFPYRYYYGTEGRFRVTDIPSLQGNRYYQTLVALGIFISAENNVEAHIQGQSDYIPVKQSAFSNEDLVSDLIGFHIGLDMFYKGERNTGAPIPEDVRKEYMKICGVVGFEYYKTGRMKEFTELQKQIWWDTKPTPFVGKHYVWGTVPSQFQWHGSYELECETFRCKKHPKVLPNRLIRLTPKSPGDGWRWMYTSNTIYREELFCGINSCVIVKKPIEDAVAYLNSLPLNWMAMGQ